MIDRIQNYESGLGSQGDALKEKALDVAAAARERISHGTEIIREYTVQQPARALGIALGMGVFLGWLIKRR